MAIVTYRGVQYDTKERNARPTVKVQAHEVYRGVKHDENVEVRK
jgi:hypothetical protein